jgi:hypothetical protein
MRRARAAPTSRRPARRPVRLPAMVDFTLVYGMRLYHGPSDQLDRIEPMRVHVQADDRELTVTAHVIEGTTREQIKQQLLRSVDAFFELH